MAHGGTPRGWRRGAALGLLAALALLVAGCGGGSDGESESASRKKLEAGAAKINGAKSMRISLLFEAEEDGESEEIGCLNLAVDTAKPERVDLTFFNLNCSGGTEAHELIAVGHRAWALVQDPESWAEARITPELLHELGNEQTEFSELMAAAEDIEVDSEGAAVEEGDGYYVDVPLYSFEAPASAFPGSDDDLGDLKVEFEAALDRHGYLRELKFHGDEDGAGATVTATYEDINQDLGITPPGPKEVKGPASPIHSRDRAVRGTRRRPPPTAPTAGHGPGRARCEADERHASVGRCRGRSHRRPRIPAPDSRARGDRPRCRADLGERSSRAPSAAAIPRARWSSPRGRRGRRSRCS